tara:strand:- start:1296 stop:1532 length:237 start_codon:yes stop_codon:yes gene_type:complete
MENNTVMVVIEKTLYFHTGVNMNEDQWDCIYKNGKLKLYQKTKDGQTYIGEVNPYHTDEDLSGMELMNETDGGYIKPK